VTFKDLQKLAHSQAEAGPSVRFSESLPFWIFNQDPHRLEHHRTKGRCCFWHSVGCPQKDGYDMPLLPYQKTLRDSLQSHKHIWIKKSRGIGCSEFLLRYITWSCLETFLPNSRVCIVTGPRIDLAENLIARFKGLFGNIVFQKDRTASTVTFLNGVKVEAFPSHHADTMRGLDNVKFIMSDESDLYPPFKQKEVRAVMEGYIGKPNSDPYIVLVSTPKAPGGLMQQIELEQDSLYHKLFFDYHYSLEGPYPIYSQEQIDKARLSPEFPREYELQYLGLVGNVFSQASMESCQKIEYRPDNVNKNARKTIGLDPSFARGSLVLLQHSL
jgi:hypothetical protein